MRDEDIYAAHLDARDTLRRSMSIASAIPNVVDMLVALRAKGISPDRRDVIAACDRLGLVLCDVTPERDHHEEPLDENEITRKLPVHSP